MEDRERHLVAGAAIGLGAGLTAWYLLHKRDDHRYRELKRTIREMDQDILPGGEAWIRELYRP